MSDKGSKRSNISEVKTPSIIVEDLKKGTGRKSESMERRRTSLQNGMPRIARRVFDLDDDMLHLMANYRGSIAE